MGTAEEARSHVVDRYVQSTTADIRRTVYEHCYLLTSLESEE